jgi:hypothetical protein
MEFKFIKHMKKQDKFQFTWKSNCTCYDRFFLKKMFIDLKLYPFKIWNFNGVIIFFKNELNIKNNND